MVIPLLLGDFQSLHASVSEWSEDDAIVNTQRDYLIGRIPEDQVLAAHPGPAHFLAAMKALRGGDRLKAIKQLEVIKDAKFTMPFSYEIAFSTGILTEMNRKPDWPQLRPQN